jgi:hypothetical protein
MPLYYITITLSTGKEIRGVKQLHVDDIDWPHQHYNALACQKLGQDNIKEFDCMMISEHSPLAALKPKKPDTGRRYK